MKRALFCGFAANLVVMVVIELVGAWCVAIGYTEMLSRYRELDVAHAIDHRIVKSTLGLDADENWAAVLDYIASDFVQSVLRSRHVVAALFGLNAIGALLLWRVAKLRSAQQSVARNSEDGAH